MQSEWNAETVRQFIDAGLKWFDRREFTFGNTLEIGEVLALAGLLPAPDFKTAKDFQDRQLLELRLVSAFCDAILEYRQRCLKRENNRLRVLNPEEQLDYGETTFVNQAMRKLRKGCRIVQHTETNDVQAKQNAVYRMKDLQEQMRRKNAKPRGVYDD